MGETDDDEKSSGEGQKRRRHLVLNEDRIFPAQHK
jgi:hypothetical protein